MEHFPHLTQATSDTPVGQACLITSIARGGPDPRTCVFILNSPDARAQHELTEPEVRAACQKAGFSGLTSVTRQTHSVFVAYFNNKYDASHARSKLPLEFAASLGTLAPSTRLRVTAETHYLEINRVFLFETGPRSVDHGTVCQRVFEALKGPLDSSILLFRQRFYTKKGLLKRTRYILRPSKAVCPIFVERFYIPLDAASGDGKVWGIFKPFNRNWTCPACHERCQSGDESTFKSSTLLLGPNTAEGMVRNNS
jgi:hypothetical protein